MSKKNPFKYRIVTGRSVKEFLANCRQAYKDDYIYISPLTVSKISQGFYFSMQWLKKEGDETQGSLNVKMVSSSDERDFSNKCSVLHNSNYLFISAPSVCGIGNGKFKHFQLWAKASEEEIIKSKEED